jgi:glutathione S-transferase
MTLTLYLAAGSCSLASQIALEEAQASYEPRALLMADGEQKQADFLAINPRGRVPALVIDGTPISETVAILTYISLRFPEAALLPFDDPDLMGKAYERMSWYASSLHVGIAQMWRTERFSAEEDGWTGIQACGRAIVESGFDEIEQRFEGPWVLGDHYSVVDGYTQVFWRWGERMGVDMSQYRRWAAQGNRLLERPAVARALASEKQALDARTAAVA